MMKDFERGDYITLDHGYLQPLSSSASILFVGNSWRVDGKGSGLIEFGLIEFFMKFMKISCSFTL